MRGDEEDEELFNKQDLEWLAWNWRAWMNIRKFNSRRNLIFEHFNRNQKFLPTPYEIFSGIILGQINDFSEHYQNVESLVPAIQQHVEMWKKIFSLAKVANMNEPMTTE